MADSRRQPAPLPQATESRPLQFLQIREAIDNHSPMNSTPSTPPSPRSPRFASRVPDGEEQRLSVIDEDGDSHVPGSRRPAPAVPARSTHRPFARRWRDAPPRASSDLEPPEYSIMEDGKPRRDRLAELRNRPGVARRGGFWRLLILILLAIVVLAVGLGVGLGVGLKNRNSNSNGSSSGSGSSSSGDDASANSTFPAGHFAITTNLETITNSCTANPSTFRCNSQSGMTGSQASFDWIITESGNKYSISTSINPFVTSFSNVPLTLVDAGAPTEHYAFSIPINISVTPSMAITSDNQQAICWYNGTTLSAALYTKMQGSAQNSSSNSQAVWQPWPFAAEINQTTAGGNNVPACYELSNGQQGALITNGLAPQPSSSQCGCFYRNYNL